MQDLAILSPDTLWGMSPRALESAIRRIDGMRMTDTSGMHGTDGALQAAVTGRNIEPMPGTRTAGIWSGVAVIPVRGMIRPQHGFMSGTSLRSLASDLTAALDSREVTAIVLDIESPGGQVTGLDEISDMIYGARGQKPIIAHCGGGMIASAALWIASACNEVVLTGSAEIGSLGVVATYIDWKAFDDRVGIKEIEIVSSQSPKKRPDPTTDDGLAIIQARIDAIADVFVDHVARNYGTPRERVLSDFGQGDLLVGEAAVTAGLAARLATFDDLMEELAGSGRTSSAFPSGIGASQMPRENTGSPTPSEKSAVTLEQIKADHPEIANALIEEGRKAGVEEGTKAGAEAERSRIKGIQELAVDGLEAHVLEASWDPEQTPEKVATECMRKLRAGEVKPSRATHDLGAPLGPGPDSPVGDSGEGALPVAMDIYRQRRAIAEKSQA